MAYSLREIVPDGALTGPRWLLHAIKAAQHAAPAFALVVLSSAITGTPHFFLCSMTAGFLVYLVVVLRKRIRHAPQNRADWFFDSAFAWLTVGGGTLADRDVVLSAILFALSIALYVGLYRRGTP